MGHFNVHDKYLIYMHKELDDLEPEAAAVNRLFAICEGGVVFSNNELDRLLEQYPSVAQKLKWCASQFYPWGASVLYPWGKPSAHTFEKYPLHVACRNNALIYVIQALIKAWPGTLQTEAGKCLPLHEARTCTKSLPTIQLLVEMWPEAIKQFTGDGYDCFGCLPLHLALKSSNANVGME